MAATHFDAIVIGTGQAGPALADRLARHGQRVAVIERDQFGGTCVNTGCIPTKTLVASAQVARACARAAEYGVRLTTQASVDMAKVKARKDEVSGQSRAGVEQWMTDNEGITVFRGHARFTGPRTAEVNGETLEAGQVFVNVGGRPSTRGVEGVDTVPHLTSTSILDLDVVPEHLLVVGGSYIGLEFAQMYRRFGSRVTVVEVGPWLIGREDEHVSREVQSILEREGIEVRLNAKCLALGRHERGVSVHLHCDGAEARIDGSHVLIAIGRQPNTDDLGLDRAGIRTDARGYIVVDDALQPRCPGCGRWGTATAAARSPTPPTTTTRSLPTTCSRGRSGASPTASLPMRSTSIRRSAAAA
jgi:pyruvate/2-oxoglutarate dehydrogenase complex dihydrolipoamide dehydrogenase (E3) component